MGFFQFFDKRVGVVSWYGQNTNIFAHLLHLDNVRLLYFLQNHIFRLKSSEKYWKSNCLLQVNFENRNRVNWHQLMFYIKWWVFVIIKMPCFHIYNIFKCHFKPNQKCQRDMNDPVDTLFWPYLKISLCWGCIEAGTKCFGLDMTYKGQRMPTLSLFTKLNGQNLSIKRSIGTLG